MSTVTIWLTSNTEAKEEKQCKCHKINLKILLFCNMVVYLYFSSAFLKKIALDTLLQIQITDLWHPSSYKTLLLLPRKEEILLKFSFAQDTVHFYHFIGPYVDGQRSTPIWQYLKAFRTDELKKQKMDAEEPNQSTEAWYCFSGSPWKIVFITEVFALGFVVGFF